MKVDSFKKGRSSEQQAKLGVLSFGYMDASSKRALISKAFRNRDTAIRSRAFDLYKEKGTINWDCSDSICDNIILCELKSIRSKGERHGFSVTQFERENQAALGDQYRFVIWYVKPNVVKEVRLSDLDACVSQKYVVWNMFFNNEIAAEENDAVL